MNKRRLGKTGLNVSEFGHGLWGMGGWSDSDDRQNVDILVKSAALGCNFFDSAHAYGEGRSDRILGQLVKRAGRQNVTIASKVAPKNGKWPGQAGDAAADVFPFEYVVTSARQIARDIGVETIDVLQFHVWSDAWAQDDGWRRAVEHLKRDGLVKSFGISINRWEPANVLKALDGGLIDAVQVIYNIFDQSPEDELFPYCRRHDIGVIARVPLDEGSLGGNMTAQTRFPADDWRARYFGPENLAPTLARVEALKRDFSDYALPELALRFIISHPAVGTVITGMRQEKHLIQNAAHFAKGPLPPEVLAKLKKHRWDRTPAPWAD